MIRIFKQYKKKKQQVAIFILCAAILLAGAYWGISAMYKNGFARCVEFQITHSATAAFVCGNHYFGVYGSSNYDIQKAEYYFGKAIEIDPNTPDAWHQYARIAFLHGNFTDALYRINMQFKMRGDELMASYYIRGLIEGYAKQYPAAEQDFLKFLEWDPDNWAANNDLAWIYFSQGKFKDSAERSEFGLKHNPYSPWLLVMHAMSVYNLGDSETAKDELKRARDIAEGLREEDWIRAYPGNDQLVAAEGLASFRKTIADNILLVENNSSSH